MVRLSSTPHLPLSLLSVADVLLDFLNPIGNDWTMARVETRGLHVFQFRERLHIRVEILKHLKMSIRCVTSTCIPRCFYGATWQRMVDMSYTSYGQLAYIIDLRSAYAPGDIPPISTKNPNTTARLYWQAYRTTLTQNTVSSENGVLLLQVQSHVVLCVAWGCHNSQRYSFCLDNHPVVQERVRERWLFQERVLPCSGTLKFTDWGNGVCSEKPSLFIVREAWVRLEESNTKPLSHAVVQYKWRNPLQTIPTEDRPISEPHSSPVQESHACRLRGGKINRWSTALTISITDISWILTTTWLPGNLTTRNLTTRNLTTRFSHAVHR